MSQQTTLANIVSCSGIGLHGGKPVHMSVYPALPNTGIVFKRADQPADRNRVPARWDLVADTRLGTTLRNKHGVSVATVEHLMAAMWGVGLDNAVVELDGPEVPIMDGSSEPFVFLLECAGLVPLASARKRLRVLKAVEVRDGQSVASVEPGDDMEDEGCSLQLEIEFENSIIRKQHSLYDFRVVTFKQALARARTFGFAHEVEALRANGLALGGSLENAVVVGEDRILNEGGLRYRDEFIRHKALDCLGDLYLAGHVIDGHFSFVRPGHAINNKLLRALFADRTAWALVASSGDADVGVRFDLGDTRYAFPVL